MEVTLIAPTSLIRMSTDTVAIAPRCTFAQFGGWTCIAPPGGLSPTSTTSCTWQSHEVHTSSVTSNQLGAGSVIRFQSIGGN